MSLSSKVFSWSAGNSWVDERESEGAEKMIFYTFCSYSFQEHTRV
jgi:hypothetical protein